MEATANVPVDADAGLREAETAPEVRGGIPAATESPPAFLPDTKAPPGADVADEDSAQPEESDSTTHWNL
jgi:hypothetical protein